ncbi:MAG: Prolipoprotein diacylglyceryl transferase [Acidimicrobiaceae bacterium]|nr:Prolipoprotein diacylglyceryl transferase [Acidimicrobiaceae bacterium]
MTGFPTAFHIGPLIFHTYGFGLAIAAYVAYLYARRRLTHAGFDAGPFAKYTVWLLISGLVGARAANIATNWRYYEGHPGRWIAVWQGGLASFGGIALALVVGLILQRRWWPGTRLAAFTDALVPALIAGWAIGRFLGPQFMLDGGGHLTHQWFGLHYHGQVGKRVPVPLIQGLEDGLLWLIVIALERTRLKKAVGVISATGMIVWGVVRATDERLLLGQESHSGSLGVQAAGLALALAGVVTLVMHWPKRDHDDRPDTTVRSPSSFA